MRIWILMALGLGARQAMQSGNRCRTIPGRGWMTSRRSHGSRKLLAEREWYAALMECRGPFRVLFHMN